MKFNEFRSEEDLPPLPQSDSSVAVMIWIAILFPDINIFL